MTYRDDREALHAKSEALQQELDETRRELARLRAEHGEATELDGLIAEPDETSSATQPRHDPHRGAIARMMVGSVLLATGLVGALAVRHNAVVEPYHYGAHGGMCPRMFYEAVHATGHVTQAANADVAVGNQCTVDVSPVPMRRFNCRVEVRCGGTTLYGLPNAGYTQCEIAQGRPYRAIDRWSSNVEGDPEMKLDLDTGRVVVSDETNSSSVTVALDRQ